MFIIRPSSTLEFFFGFNGCLSVIFSLDYQIWENIWFFIWVVVVGHLILQHKWLRVTSYPMWMNKKLECKDHQYIPKCWERSVERNSNLSFITQIKIHLLTNIFYIYGPKLSKNSLLAISCSLLRTSPHQQSNFIMQDMQYFNFFNVSITRSFFLRSFSLMHALVCSLH